jgi:hypothetical protein
MLSKKALFAFAFVFGMSILLFSVLNAETYLNEIKDYIEVCANGPTYVPPDTSFVRCYGVIRRVVAISDSITEEEEDCQCPKCCDGLCYVIIYTDPAHEAGDPEKRSDSKGIRDIKYLWMPC